MTGFTHEECFSTLWPIKEAIDYLLAHNYDPGVMTLDSIVCTEDYEIKLLDSFFEDETIGLKQRDGFETVIYEELFNILFDVLFPDQVHIKSRKSRYDKA